MDLRPRTVAISIVVTTILWVSVIAISTDNPIIEDIKSWMINHTNKK